MARANTHWLLAEVGSADTPDGKMPTLWAEWAFADLPDGIVPAVFAEVATGARADADLPALFAEVATGARADAGAATLWAEFAWQGVLACLPALHAEVATAGVGQGRTVGLFAEVATRDPGAAYGGLAHAPQVWVEAALVPRPANPRECLDRYVAGAPLDAADEEYVTTGYWVRRYVETR